MMRVIYGREVSHLEIAMLLFNLAKLLVKLEKDEEVLL